MIRFWKSSGKPLYTFISWSMFTTDISTAGYRGFPLDGKTSSPLDNYYKKVTKAPVLLKKTLDKND